MSRTGQWLQNCRFETSLNPVCLYWFDHVVVEISWQSFLPQGDLIISVSWIYLKISSDGYVGVNPFGDRYFHE